MDTNQPPRATRREWVGLAVIALPCVLYAMDLTVLNVALPHLSEALHPSSSELLWIVDIYGFLVAGFLITMGTLGDRIGRRRLLMLGAAAFGGASVLAAFSTSAGMLIGARALLGIAGATLAPSTLSLIRNMFLDPEQRTVAIGVWTTSFSIGAVAGPLLGGVILQHFWWGGAFLLAVPVMLLLLLIGPRLLPEYRDPGAGRLDLVSALLSLSAVLLVIYGVKAAAKDGFGWHPSAFVAVGAAVGWVFVRRQRTLREPLIDLRLFRSPTFRVSLAAFTLTTLVVFGFYVFMAQYLQLVLGLSPTAAGLWTLPGSFAIIIGSSLAPLIVRRVQPAYVLGAGIGLTSLGFAFIALFADRGLLALVSGQSLAYLGLGPVYTLGTDLIVGAAPPERAGAAAALSETSSEFGGALGIAVLGSIGTATYRARMAHADLARIPAAACRAARETLGGASAVAARLNPGLGAQLLGAARAAFTHSMRQSAAICAVVAAATALAALLMLRPTGQRAKG